MKVTMCGKRTARFMCTLEAGHKGPHGRNYRRQPAARSGIEYEVREINEDGDAIDVVHFNDKRKAVAYAQDSVNARCYPKPAVATVVERHDWNRDNTDIPGSYRTILTLGDVNALRAGSWIDPKDC